MKQTEKNSCDAQVTNRILFVRKTKNDNHQDPLVIPERIEQAGSHAVIYDQQGNIVLYEVRFSKNMCDLKLIQNQPYFPAGTTELKQAWKIMTPSDNTEQYFTMDAKVQFEDGQTTESLKLGLIGFHIAISTDDHPEMIWITYEHKTNVPNCKQPITSDEKALVANTQWSFTSKACAESINQAGQFNNTCHFNQPLKNQTATKGIPTEICRVNHNGTSPNQDVQQNNQPLNQLNNAFQQQDLSASNQWARVWQNYMMVGALWLSQPYNAVKTNAFNPSAASFGKQRGSLALANSVMETDFQDVGSNLSGNCFGCHNFKVNQGSSTLPTKALIAQHNKDTSKIEWEKETLEGSSGALSHIMNKIIAGQCDINYLPENLLFAQFGSLDIGKVSKYCQKTCQSNNQAWTGNYKLIKTRGGQLPETRNQCECCQYKTQL